MARPPHIPEEWAKDLVAAGLVNDKGEPSKEALRKASGLNPSVINTAFAPEKYTRSGTIELATIEKLAAAVKRPVGVIQERVNRHVKVRELLTADEARLVRWYRTLDEQARQELDQLAAHIP